MGAVAGVGIDVVDIGRFERSKPRVRERLFTRGEASYCIRQIRPGLHFASRFAAKEAVLKALGTGWSGGIAWTDVEIVREAHGRATVNLTGQALKVAKKLKIRRWHVSMTHTATTAAAIAVAEN
jgi:holo-[acyl-carrier protein] synthase